MPHLDYRQIHTLHTGYCHRVKRTTYSHRDRSLGCKELTAYSYVRFQTAPTHILTDLQTTT